MAVSRTEQSAGSAALSAKDETLEGKGRVRRQRHDLAGGVHAAVGPSRRRHFDRLAEQLGERLFQDARDRPVHGLPLEAAKLASVVLDGQPKVGARGVSRAGAAAERAARRGSSVVRQKHDEAVDADADSGRRRHAVFEGAHEIPVGFGDLFVAGARSATCASKRAR